jgi:hypothetical protein
MEFKVYLQHDLIVILFSRCNPKHPVLSQLREIRKKHDEPI